MATTRQPIRAMERNTEIRLWLLLRANFLVAPLLVIPPLVLEVGQLRNGANVVGRAGQVQRRV